MRLADFPGAVRWADGQHVSAGLNSLPGDWLSDRLLPSLAGYEPIGQSSGFREAKTGTTGQGDLYSRFQRKTMADAYVDRFDVAPRPQDGPNAFFAVV